MTEKEEGEAGGLGVSAREMSAFPLRNALGALKGSFFSRRS